VIRRGDFAVVLRGKLRGVGLRRRIGRVRLVEVEEKEERTVLGRVEPWLRGLQRLPARPLQAAEPGAGAKLDAVLVEVEAGRDPALALEHVGRDRAAGLVPGLLQRLGQKR